MMHSIHSLQLAVTNLDSGCRPYSRLDLPVSQEDGLLAVGSNDSPVSLEFLATAEGLLAEPRRQALEEGRPLFAITLNVDPMQRILDRVASRGIEPVPFEKNYWLPLHDQAGASLIIRLNSPSPSAKPGFLKRLDHLAIVAHDLDAKTRFWNEVLGVPAVGEVATPTMIIRQLRIGDAILELLGPASDDSPLWKRPPGLISMASWEVEDLDAAVAHVRKAGFSVNDPAPGPLPRTRIATVAGVELAGVNMQLLQYVP